MPDETIGDRPAPSAPQVGRAGKALDGSVAPKVSAILSSAARRLEPSKPQRRSWRKLAGISVLTAAASAAAAIIRSRAKPDLISAQTKTDNVAPVAQRHEGKAATNADADVHGQVRTS